MPQTILLADVQAIKLRPPLVGVGQNAQELEIVLETTPITQLKQGTGSTEESVTSADLISLLTHLIPDSFSTTQQAQAVTELAIGAITTAHLLRSGSGTMSASDLVLSQIAIGGGVAGKYNKVIERYQQDLTLIPANIIVLGNDYPTRYYLKDGGNAGQNPETEVGRGGLESNNWLNLDTYASSLGTQVLQKDTVAELPIESVVAFEGAEAWIGLSDDLAVYRVVNGTWRDSGLTVNKLTGAVTVTFDVSAYATNTKHNLLKARVLALESAPSQTAGLQQQIDTINQDLPHDLVHPVAAVVATTLSDTSSVSTYNDDQGNAVSTYTGSHDRTYTASNVTWLGYFTFIWDDGEVTHRLFDDAQPANNPIVRRDSTPSIGGSGATPAPALVTLRACIQHYNV